MSPTRPMVLVALVFAGAPGGAWAQKNSGTLIPVTPAPTYVRPAPVPAPLAPPAPAPAAPRAGSNPQVEQLAQALPLDPATRDLTNREPADISGVERRLSLRETRGPRTDLRGHTPSTREIVDALAPR